MFKGVWTRLLVSRTWMAVVKDGRFVMRRRVGDQIQYRECSEEELQEALEQQAVM